MRLALFLLAVTVLALSRATGVHNGTYQVLRIVPRSWHEIERLAVLRGVAEDHELDFWLDSRQPGQFADVMVAPSAAAGVRDWLTAEGLQFSVTIPDVETLIRLQEHASVEGAPEGDEALQHVRLRDVPLSDDDAVKFGERPFELVRRLKGFNYPFGEYTNYATMLRYMRTIEFYYPHLAKLIRIGTTHEGRPIEGLKIGYHVSNSTKRVFWIDGNIHAREWASSHTALFVINQLVGGYGKDPLATHYLNHLNFLIVPCLNPDGYEFSRSSKSPEIRLWRKNRSPERCAESRWGGTRCCQGVDLNRNFDFHWAESGASTNPCSNLFAGDSAFSEPESRAVFDFLLSNEYRHKVDGFITLHTYAQLWIHPFSHEVEYYPNDIGRLTRVAEQAVSRLRDVYGTQFRIGTGADLLSPAAGGSDDWAKETLDAKYVYLIELRPQLELSRGFILRQDELVPTAIETFEGIKVVIEAVLEDNGIRPRPHGSNKMHENGVSVARVHSVANVAVDEKSRPWNGDKFVQGRFGTVEDRWQRPEVTSTMEGTTTVATTQTTTTTPPPTTTTTTATTTTTTTSTTPSTTTTTTTTATPSTITTTPTPITTLSMSTTVSSTTSVTTSTTPSTTTTLPTSTVSILTVPPTAASSKPPADTMARRLTQELLRKQLLRIQALKSIKDRHTTRTTPSPTIVHAPRFLTGAPLTPSTSTSSPTTTPMPLPPLLSGGGAHVTAPRPPRTCIDKKYSCVFWIKADKHVCEEQQRFMRLNCARSCRFCEQS